jgi:hypothetical protein
MLYILNYSFETVFHNSLILWVEENMLILYSLLLTHYMFENTHRTFWTVTFVNSRSLNTTLRNPQFKGAVKIKANLSARKNIEE